MLLIGYAVWRWCSLALQQRMTNRILPFLSPITLCNVTSGQELALPKAVTAVSKVGRASHKDIRRYQPLLVDQSPSLYCKGGDLSSTPGVYLQ